MRPIQQCSSASCGIRLGYPTPDGPICWVHAERQRLPAHREWLRELAAFLKTFNSGAVATKRDNYGVLGRGW